MAVAHHLRIAQPAGIVYTGMVFLVAQDDVVSAGQRADDSEVGLEPGGKGNGVLLPEKIRELSFQRDVLRKRSV